MPPLAYKGRLHKFVSEHKMSFLGCFFSSLSISLRNPAPSHPVPCPAPPTFSSGRVLLADDLLQAADDAVLVVQALAVVCAQGLHVPAVLNAVPAQLQSVLLRLLLQLLQV